MFSKLFYKLKKDKFLLVVIAVSLAVLLFNFITLIFNVVNYFSAKSNASKLSKAFIVMNTVSMIFDAVVLILVIVYVIIQMIKRRKRNVWFVES